MTVSYISEGTGIPFNTVQKILPKLKSKNMIFQAVGKNGKIEIGIKKDYQKWHSTTENGMPKTAENTVKNGSKTLPKTVGHTTENGIQINKPLKKKENIIKKSGSPSPLMGEASASEWLSADARERLKAANVLSYPEQPTEHALKIMQIHGYTTKNI